MAGRLSLWGAGQILRAFFTKTAEPPPSFFLALIRTNAPSPYNSGGELDEPDGASYARAEIPNDALSWSSNDDQLHLIFNEAEISFVTAQEDWGRIAYWALCNADSGGYVYFMGEMEEEQIVLTGDQAVIADGEVIIELGPFFTPEDF